MASLDNSCSVDTQRVTVIAVEVGRECASTLVSEVVGHWRELALVFWVVFQAGGHQIDDKFLSLDLGHLNVAMWVTIQKQLLRDVLG